MTLGPAILLLAWLDRARLAKTNPLIVFGRVPLFYFIVHMFVIHALTIPFAFAFSRNGYDLWVVYAVWIAVVVLLYPLCLWFAARPQQSTRRTQPRGRNRF